MPNPARPTTPSTAGITLNADGQQIIPASQRPDGTTRREIKVRPGYRPPEDVEVYKNRTAEAWKNRGSGGVPGAAPVSDSDTKGDSSASNKNAKRKALRKKAKEKEGKGDAEGEKEKVKVKLVPGEGAKEEVKAGVEVESKESPVLLAETSSQPASPKPKPEQTQEEKEKLAKAIRKKIRRVNEIKDKQEKGEILLPDQLEKVARLGELTKQLSDLGFD